MINIITSSIVTIAIILGIFNTATMSSLKYATLDYWFGTNLGSFTTISSTDKMSDFPTTYNANLAKTIEVGTTSIPTITTLSGLTTANALTSASSLATVGTITTGVWNASIIDELYGGTGTSTPTGILWGNGNSFFQIATGTTGYVLTSNGNDSAPTFQQFATDEAGNYAWTGLHTWSNGSIFNGTTTLNASTTLTATTTIAASSVTNNALILNTVPYAFPSADGLVGQYLSTDGSGALSWASSTATYAVGTFSTTTTAHQTNNNVITVGFQPRIIRLKWFYQGHTPSGGTNVYAGAKGGSIYSGTTLIAGWQDVTSAMANSDQGDFTTVTVPSAVTGYNTTSVVGDSGGSSGGVKTSFSVSAISSTGFTIQVVTDLSGQTNTNNARVDLVYEAIK